MKKSKKIKSELEELELEHKEMMEEGTSKQKVTVLSSELKELEKEYGSKTAAELSLIDEATEGKPDEEALEEEKKLLKKLKKEIK